MQRVPTQSEKGPCSQPHDTLFLPELSTNPHSRLILWRQILPFIFFPSDFENLKASTK